MGAVAAHRAPRARALSTAPATPTGCAGEEIPIGSRIILACDAYSAMTTDRARTARRCRHGAAIAELARCAGTQFDPRVTEALIGCLYWMAQARSLPAA